MAESWDHMRDVRIGGGLGLVSGVGFVAVDQIIEDHRYHNALNAKVKSEMHQVTVDESNVSFNSHQPFVSLEGLGDKFFLASFRQQVIQDKQNLSAEVQAKHHNPDLSPTTDALGLSLPLLVGVGLARLKSISHHRRHVGKLKEVRLPVSNEPVNF